jgi:hypothetical protein
MPIVFKTVLMAHVLSPQETVCTVRPWSDRLSSSGFSKKVDFLITDESDNWHGR